MKVRYTQYDGQLIKELRRETKSDRMDVASRILNEARATAPVLEGDYRGGMHIESSGDEVSVVDSDPEAIYKEFGTSQTPAHASLTNAARRYGKYTGWQPRGR